jgi:DNA-binding beta-propeller fold protein YncE
LLKQLTTPPGPDRLALTTVGSFPQAVRSDGTDLWVANFGDGTVSRVRGGDGKLLETRPGGGEFNTVLIAMGQVFVTDAQAGVLVRFDPAVFGGGQVVASGLGTLLSSTAFDGLRIWTVNHAGHSVSIVTPGPVTPWTVTTVTTGFNSPYGALFDGSNVWVTDDSSGTLLKLSGSGAVLQTVTVGAGPAQPVFDGTNIWVPNQSGNSISVVRGSTGAVLTTLTGNGLFSPTEAAFDGQRVLVTDRFVDAVSLWKAADLSPLGFVDTGSNTQPMSACSDGIHFWITLTNAGKLARF